MRECGRERLRLRVFLRPKASETRDTHSSSESDQRRSKHSTASLGVEEPQRKVRSRDSFAEKPAEVCVLQE